MDELTAEERATLKEVRLHSAESIDPPTMLSLLCGFARRTWRGMCRRQTSTTCLRRWSRRARTKPRSRHTSSLTSANPLPNTPMSQRLDGVRDLLVPCLSYPSRVAHENQGQGITMEERSAPALAAVFAAQDSHMLCL